MVKIEAVIQPFKLDDVKAALDGLGVERITIVAVTEHGRSVSQKGVYRGAEYLVDAPRVKLEMFVSSLRVDEVIEALSSAARTRGSGDDGAIFVYEVAEALRIRSGARLEPAFS